MNNNYLVNKVFSQTTFEELTRIGKSQTVDDAYEKYISKETYTPDLNMKFKELYDYMKKRYRNEYFFKNTLLNKLLLGVHSPNTTIALTEVPISQSIADFVLINGKAIVYEIKTEYDNLDKLDKQINDYYKVFDHVTVLTVDKYRKKLEEQYKDSSIGISLLTKRNTISVIQKPKVNRNQLEHKSIYKLLRQNERDAIIINQLGYLPETNQFSKFDDYLKIFESIPMVCVYDESIKILKKRGKFNEEIEEINKIPYEIRTLYYFNSFSTVKKKKLFKLFKEE